MKETELAQPVVEWLESQHWDVYQEVECPGGYADIVAVRDNYLWIIECKTSFSLKVVEQAMGRRAHFRSIAIPKTRGSLSENGIEYDLLRIYQIGALVVSKHSEWNERSSIQVWREPPLMREYHKQSKRLISKLEPEHKFMCAAGSVSGDRWTPYRSTMKNVREIINKHPGITIKELMILLDGRHHYMSQSAKTSLAKSLASWESSWCEIKMIENKNHYFIRGEQ